MASRKYWQSAVAKRVKQIAGQTDIDQAVASISEGLMKGLVGPPSNLEELARRVGVLDIRMDNSMIVPGELRKLQDGLVVFLLPNLSKPRRRFTLAHELGHAYLENTGRRPQPSQELERLCDKFAAEFLMPRKTFISRAGTHPDLEGVHELCGTFATSLTSTLGRVSDLYKYRAIELKDNRVIWRRGLRVPVLRQVIHQLRTLSGQSGAEVIDLYETSGYTRWNLEWSTLGGDNHKIGLLYPVLSS